MAWQKKKLETSNSTPSHNSITLKQCSPDDASRIKGVLSLANQFLVSGLLFGNKWKPTHAVHPLVDCISLINPCQSLITFFLFLFFFLPESKEDIRVKKKKNIALLLLGVYVCTLNLTTGHREGSERVLCCWSPPLPFACLSDVLLGWAPHSDGVDKMTGGGHTPVNVNLAAKHRSAEAPTHQNRKRREL